jgi:hypothetical protein
MPVAVFNIFSIFSTKAWWWLNQPKHAACYLVLYVVCDWFEKIYLLISYIFPKRLTRFLLYIEQFFLSHTYSRSWYIINIFLWEIRNIKRRGINHNHSIQKICHDSKLATKVHDIQTFTVVLGVTKHTSVPKNYIFLCAEKCALQAAIKLKKTNSLRFF